MFSGLVRKKRKLKKEREVEEDNREFIELNFLRDRESKPRA